MKRSESMPAFVVEQTGVRRGRPVIVAHHLRGAGWAAVRRAPLTEERAERLVDAGVDLVRLRCGGRTLEVRLPMSDVRDGPRTARSTFVSVWETIARASVPQALDESATPGIIAGAQHGAVPAVGRR